MDYTTRELLKRYTKMALGQPFAPVLLNILVTSVCDMRCTHCFFTEELDDRPRKKLQMKTQEIDRIAQTLGGNLGVLATFTEGVPNFIMECMALGKPVVVSDGGGSGELVLDGKTGFLVAPQDPLALAEKMEFLLDNPDIACSMGRAGRERIEKHFSLGRMVDQTLELYEHVLNGSARSRLLASSLERVV